MEKCTDENPRSSAVIDELSHIAVARSITCSNSRILPGQLWVIKGGRAFGEKVTAGFPNSRAYLPRKWRASSGMSSRLSRKGGSANEMIFRR